MIEFFLPGRLDGLNAVVDANRTNRYAGAKHKKEITEALAWQIRAENIPPLLDVSHHFKFTWYEPNRRRDPDNVASAVKFVFDALQVAGVIPDDGWNDVASIAHEFVVADEVGVMVEVTE